MNELDEIRARVAAATHGPWRTGASGVVAGLEYTAMGIRTDADAEFIAHAREDVPRLLGALDAVLDLHARDGEGDCTYCADYFCDTRKAEYPCETVRAVIAALKGAGDEG